MLLLSALRPKIRFPARKIPIPTYETLRGIATILVYPAYALDVYDLLVSRYRGRGNQEASSGREEDARREINALLSATKWMGIACYVVWTAKDVLAGAGIASGLRVTLDYLRRSAGFVSILASPDRTTGGRFGNSAMSSRCPPMAST